MAANPAYDPALDAPAEKPPLATRLMYLVRKQPLGAAVVAAGDVGAANVHVPHVALRQFPVVVVADPQLAVRNRPSDAGKGDRVRVRGDEGRDPAQRETAPPRQAAAVAGGELPLLAQHAEAEDAVAVGYGLFL